MDVRSQSPNSTSFSSSSAFPSAPAQAEPLTLQQARVSRDPIPVHADVSNGEANLFISPQWLDTECRKLDSEPMESGMKKREQIEHAIIALQTGVVEAQQTGGLSDSNYLDNNYLSKHRMGDFKLNHSLTGIDHVLYTHDKDNQICSISVRGTMIGDRSPVLVEIGEEIPAERISFAEPPPKRPRLSTADALGYRKDVQESSQAVTSNNVAAASSSSANVPLGILPTPYDNLKVDEKVLAELYNLPLESRTAVNLYIKLGNDPRSPRISELVHFDNFLKEKGVSIEEALKNFGAHVQLENAFCAANEGRFRGIPVLRTLCFPTTPSLSVYRSVIGEDEWNTLSKDKQKKLQSELYSIDRHLACRGQHIDTLLGNPDNPREFIKQTQGLRTNQLLRPPLRLLRQNKWPLSLDTKLADKIDLMETTDNQKKVYGQLALDLADYACLHGIGDDADAFIERIRSALAGAKLDPKGLDAEFLQTLYAWTGNERDAKILLKKF